MQTRRSFLKKAASSTVALGLSRATGFTQTKGEWRNRQSDMSYRRLGRTDFMISEVVMGGDEITPDNYEHVLLAMDRGLNYLDTSPAYGRGKSENGFARVIKARNREQFFLTSKVSLWDNNRNELFEQIFDSLPASDQQKLTHRVAEELERRGTIEPSYLGNYFGSQRRELDAAMLSNVMEKEYGRRIDRKKNFKQLILDSVHESLTRLGTDHLDTLMCPHGASSPEELLNYPEIFEVFDELKTAGKVRHLGVSAHSDPAGVLRATVKSKMYSVAMVAYNIVNHRFMVDALNEAQTADVGVIAMKVARPVYPGPNRGDGNSNGINQLKSQIKGEWKLPQKAYLWGLKNKNLSGVISNMVDADQVNDNVKLPSALSA